MDPLGAPTLLTVWETGRTLSPVGRALLLLRAGWPDHQGADWRDLPIGLRDQWLVALRARLFGTRFEMLADCPACRTALETNFDAADLPAGGSAPPDDIYALAWNGYEVRYRLPSSADLAAALAAPGEDAAEIVLARCVEGLSRNGAALAAEAIGPELRDRIEAAMAAAEPAAEIDVGLVCGTCDHAFERRFDIVDYLWGELCDWAERVLAEVHVLASAYGWSEEAVLRLSGARRQHYLGLVSA